MHQRLAILVIALAWVACGPSPEDLEATAAAETAAAPTPVPDPARGEALFFGDEGVVGAQACIRCHRFELDDVEATAGGPGFRGLAERAASRVPGLSAEDYIRQSIVDPEAYYVERSNGEDWLGRGGPDSVSAMPTNYGETLSEQDINDLVAFLMTHQDDAE